MNHREITVKDAIEKAIIQKSKEMERYLTPPPEPVKFEESSIPSVRCEYCFEKEDTDEQHN